jgi:hypothetical protein
MQMKVGVLHSPARARAASRIHAVGTPTQLPRCFACMQVIALAFSISVPAFLDEDMDLR